MDKQKQIEEMAKLVQQDMCGDIPCEECNYHGKMKILPRYCGVYLIAEKFYRAGYRKIPENAVVLTREEFEVYEFVKKKHASNEEVRSSEIVQGILHHIKTVRKETAEKFAEKLKNWNDKVALGGWVEVELAVINNAVNEIGKEITGKGGV